MLTLRLEAWNYQPVVQAGEVRDNHSVFDVTLDEQEGVQVIQEQLNALERGLFWSSSAMFRCYRYQFTFRLDGVTVQVYSGSSNSALWQVQENGDKISIDAPGAVLKSLHELVGLPIWSSSSTI
jgi:hypothetical protein